MSDEQAQPRTWWSGESSPEDKNNIALAGAAALLAFTVVSPLSVLFAGLCLFLFSRVRISHRVIGGFSLLYFVFITITGLLQKGIAWYAVSFDGIMKAIQQEVPVDAEFVFRVLLHQLTLSIFVGTLIGFIVCWYKWLRRPVWQEANFRMGPIQFLMKKKNVKDLKEGKNPPHNGATLGINGAGKKVVQTDEEAGSHTFIVGASGTGKTTTMMSQSKDHIRRGHGLVFIDLKGGADVPEVLYNYAQRYGRDFYHFTILDPRDPYEGPDPSGPAYYDPLGRGDASRRKDMIIAGRKWSEDYYKIVASSYLQTAFNVAIAVPPEEGVDSLSDIISLLNPTNLGARVRRMPQGGHFDEIRAYADDWTQGKLSPQYKSAIDGVAKELQNLRGSSAGKWLRMPPPGVEGKMINLKNAAKEGAVVIFSLDSSNYQELASLVANFIVQDLKTVTSELRVDPSSKPMHVYLDEFSAMDSENVINLINKARDAKMPVSLSTQALGDLRRINPSFTDQLLGIINCFIIHRGNTEDDMEIYAGLTGKTKKWKARYGVEHASGGIIGGGLGKGAATGSGTVEQVEDYRVSPNEIYELKRGQAIYVAMSPDQRLEKVTVIPEDGKTATEDDKGVRTIATAKIDVEDDYTVNTISLSPEMVRPRMKKGLQQESPLGEITQGDEEDEEVPSIDLDNIVPKHSSGMLNGRDLNALLKGTSTSSTPSATTPSATTGERVTTPNINPAPTVQAAKKTLPTAPARPQSPQVKSAPSPASLAAPVAQKAPQAPRKAPSPAAVPTSPKRLPSLPKTEAQSLPTKPKLPVSPAGKPAPAKQSPARPVEPKAASKKNNQGQTGSEKKSVVGDWDDVW